jgi:surfeit locus 1 family protein
MIIRLVVIAIAVAILLGLGTWQVQRLAWKNDVIARIDSRIGAAPVALPPARAWESLDVEDWEYRPVTLTGRFDHVAETRVYTALTEPQTDTEGAFKGPGFWVMTPLVLVGDTPGEAGIVIINRGFVPQGRATPQARGETEPPQGVLTITGLLRAPELRVPFAPENNAAADDWYLRDPADIAAARGLERVAPFTVDAAAIHTPAGGLPQSGETRISIRNNHLQYAITWYALAVVLLLMSVLWLRRDRRGPSEPRDNEK